MNGFQDAVDQFAEFDPTLINNEDDAHFFDFPLKDDANLSGLEVQADHHPQIQTIQGDQHNPVVDFESSAT